MFRRLSRIVLVSACVMGYLSITTCQNHIAEITDICPKVFICIFSELPLVNSSKYTKITFFTAVFQPFYNI